MHQNILFFKSISVWLILLFTLLLFSSPGNLPAAADDLICSFSNMGIWKRISDSGLWSKLNKLEAISLASGDFDGNKVADIAGIWPSGLWIFYDSGLWERISKSENLVAIAVGDFNGDNHDDLIGSFDIGVWWRDSASGKWTRLHAQKSPMITAGDFDQDGLDDLLGIWDNWIWIRYATGFWQKVNKATDFPWITVGDLNGDNIDDIVGSWSHGVWYRNSANGSWIKLAPAAEQLCTGDLDGDNLDDVIGMWSTNPGIWVRYSGSGVWNKLSNYKALSIDSIKAPEKESPIWVMGYYIGYQSGDQAPSEVDYSTMTHIMVGALMPQTDGTFNTSFYIGNPAGSVWAKDTINRAHNAKIKAIAMVGGAGSDNYNGFRATQDPVIRTAFVNNLLEIVNTYGFDGIDLDWEPIVISSDPNLDDRPILSALAEAIRAAMPDKIMTIPLGSNNRNFDNMKNPYYGQLSHYFDRVNMMSYQMNWTQAGWESWHSSPLFGETPSTPTSIDNTMKAYLAAGIPKEKIGIGVGFYGQPYEQGSWQPNAFVHTTSGPYISQPHQNTDNAWIRFSDNEVSYSNIMRYYYEETAYHWDDVAKVPYLSWSEPKWITGAPPSWANEPMKTGYVTYDNEASITEKGWYVKQQGLGGIIIWTISQGYLKWQTSGEKDPLMKAMKVAFITK
jgi:chitinase